MDTKGLILAVAAVSAAAIAFAGAGLNARPRADTLRLPSGPWRGAAHTQARKAATSLPSKITIVKPNEPGDPLVVTGVVYRADGVTPAVGVAVEVHHTDKTGEYHMNPVTKRAKIQGDLQTDAQGRYEFRTIKPGSYPGGDAAAHIHFRVTGAGITEQYPDDLLFAGDPHLPRGANPQVRREGQFANVCAPRRDSAGVLHCVYNIRLK